MKYCPACSSQYSDDTLSFCLQDGTPLEGGAKQSTIDTVAFTNPATVEKLYKTDDFAAAPAGKTQNFSLIRSGRQCRCKSGGFRLSWR